MTLCPSVVDPRSNPPSAPGPSFGLNAPDRSGPAPNNWLPTSAITTSSRKTAPPYRNLRFCIKIEPRPRGTAVGGAISSSTGITAMESGPPRRVADARIDQRIRQIQQKIRGGNRQDHQQDAALDDRKVETFDRGVHQVPYAGITKDCLGNQRARDNIAE